MVRSVHTKQKAILSFKKQYKAHQNHWDFSGVGGS